MSTLQLGISRSPSSLSSPASLLPLCLRNGFRVSTKFYASLAENSKHFNNSQLSVKQSERNRSLKTHPRFFSSRISCSAERAESSQELVNEKSVSVILLAGGKGKRMGASMPKQYLPLLGQPIALYSFYTFSKMPEVKEIVVVCDPSYQDIFEDARKNVPVDVKFALPGKERQDSVYSGLEVHTFAVCGIYLLGLYRDLFFVY